MNKLKNRVKQFWAALKSSTRMFIKHDTSTLGAALSYYTVFSIAPIIIIVISLVGLLLGQTAVEGELTRQLQGLFGSESADFWQDVVKAAYNPGKNVIIAIIAVIVLVVGATSVFGQLRTSLNVIWNVKASAKKPVLKFIVDRLFSFAMIGCLIFLLLVSLVIHTGLEAFTHVLNSKFPGVSVVTLKILDQLFSLIVTVFLFSLVYKFMSDAKLKWKYVWEGSFFTSILFLLGKYIIAVYLGKSGLNSEYGAAASVVIVLVWVFYSSQIFFFGAEFTRELASQRGVLLDSNAVKNNSEKEG